MKAHELRVVLAGLAAAAMAVACAMPAQGEFINAKVAPTVGKRFSETDHSRPTGALMRIQRDDGSVREYEYQWNNGCAYALLVDVPSDVVLSWRYISDPEPCLKIGLHTFGT